MMTLLMIIILWFIISPWKNDKMARLGLYLPPIICVKIIGASILWRTRQHSVQQSEQEIN